MAVTLSNAPLWAGLQGSPREVLGGPSEVPRRSREALGRLWGAGKVVDTKRPLVSTTFPEVPGRSREAPGWFWEAPGRTREVQGGPGRSQGGPQEALGGSGEVSHAAAQQLASRSFDYDLLFGLKSFGSEASVPHQHDGDN